MTKRGTVRTEKGMVVTMRMVNQTMGDPVHAFAVNYGLNQYGNAMAKKIVALIVDGHDVSASSNGNTDGFIVDGHYRSCREILGRNWWR